MLDAAMLLPFSNHETVIVESRNSAALLLPSHRRIATQRLWPFGLINLCQPCQASAERQDIDLRQA